ncbi:MAG: energy-coupling factor transporter ATP-binding protein EcfA2 [Pseudomonadales bacterium]|jgi:energy-coupling factor transporter ATP-binding protein EcfA2
MNSSDEDTPMPPSSEESQASEAEILSEIVTWSNDRPLWQRDALRRLCNADGLEQEEIESLLEICKGAKGGVPITADHIRNPSASTSEVSLLKLHNVQSVNALQPGETLTFQKSGLTVIYGDNGAGKSGYARVLKHACRARQPKDDAVLPNAYGAQTGTPQAEIGFRVGGQNQSTIWKQGTSADARLTAISVFDSSTAAIHVDATNDLAYTPLPLRVMASLAEACKTLKRKFDEEIKAIESQTPTFLREPDCDPNTAVGKLIAGLSSKTKDSTVTELATLSESEEARLRTLAADLANDPLRVARQLQGQKAEIDKAKERLTKLAEAVSESNTDNVKELKETYDNARAAAALVSADLFSEEPLPEVGSDVWRSLWNAARAYSDHSAYPDQKFPFTGKNARCVLCHQELDVDAAKRLNQFEAFVLDESKKREEEARKAYQTARSALAATRITMLDIRSTVSWIKDNLADEILADNVRRCAVQNSWRLRAILRADGLKGTFTPIAVSAVPEGQMSAHTQALKKRASGFRAEKDSPERKALQIEHNELYARDWLRTVQTDVLNQINRLKSLKTLEAQQKTTSTNKITSFSTEIAKRLVTDRLKERFFQEIGELGVAEQHDVELIHARSSAGIPLFHVRMSGNPSQPVGKILSEGEHRCVALAAFLSELSTLDTQSGIVFDDPVSSLDHIHRDRVAERLARESLNRQVIVFTHDIAFLVLLEEACRKTREHPDIPIAYRVVSRGANAAGFCNQEPPANVLPIDKVVSKMRSHLGNVRIHYDRGDQANWRREVSSFSVQLREAWERAVEDAVSPVIRRLAQKVQTGGLVRLTVLQEQDCHEMRDAYGRCSQLLHSQPGAINPRLPSPADIEDEISHLERWTLSIKNRQNRVQ